METTTDQSPITYSSKMMTRRYITTQVLKGSAASAVFLAVVHIFF